MAEGPYDAAVTPLAFNVVAIEAFAVPSNETDPVVSPVSDIVLAVVNFAADVAAPPAELDPA